MATRRRFLRTTTLLKGSETSFIRSSSMRPIRARPLFKESAPLRTRTVIWTSRVPSRTPNRRMEVKKKSWRSAATNSRSVVVVPCVIRKSPRKTKTRWWMVRTWARTTQTQTALSTATTMRRTRSIRREGKESSTLVMKKTVQPVGASRTGLIGWIISMNSLRR